jgi:hypothetical protein
VRSIIVGAALPMVPATWHGTLVLKQMLIDRFTGFPPSQPTFEVSAGSTVDWKRSGTDG